MSNITKQMIKLVALDLDGTTLNNHHELTDRTIAVLNRLSSKGVIIAIATGRSVANITRYIPELGLAQQTILPAVVYNGAVGLKFDNSLDVSARVKSVVFENQLPISSAEILVKFSTDNGFVLQVKTFFQTAKIRRRHFTFYCTVLSCRHW